MTTSSISSGQIVSGIVSLGDTLVVENGGTASGTQVLSGGSATILAGATVSNLVVAGGSVTLGGTERGGTISSGGSVTVEGALYGQAGTAAGVTVMAGGGLSTLDGVISGTILSGGTLDVGGVGGGFAGGTALSTTVLSGGVLVAEGYGVASAAVVRSGGREIVGVNGNAVGVAIAGGTLELKAGSFYDAGSTNQVNGPIVFSSDGGTILDDGSEAPSSLILGFDATDRIILAAVPADPRATMTVNGDIVTVSAGGHSYAMDIEGASSVPFSLGIGTTSGNIDIGVACYCTGTAILTDHGEVPVEALAAGDRVITADGRAEPVVWVGRRSYGGRFLAGQRHLLPVRFRAGSLGGGLPRRDLLVSPCHAMLLRGVLVEAGMLANGSTIVQEGAAERVDYVHIELARHDTILAEGAASETYLDDGNRLMFANARSYPGGGADGDYCAPRVAVGYLLERIRQELAAVAQAGNQAA